MCEVLIRLEDKNDDPLTFSQGDAVDIFNDGRLPDQVVSPHAVIKIPGYPKENLRWLLKPHQIYNPEMQKMDTLIVRLYFIDASIIDTSLVTELRTNRVIIVDSNQINGSIRNRVTGEIYND